MADQQDQQGVPVQIDEEVIPPQVVQQQNIQVLSIENISSIIKEAVGGVKGYIDDALSVQKSKVLESSKVQLKFKGNKIQYEFNVEQLERVEFALTKIEKGETQFAVDSLKKVISEFKTRNKHIKLADKSEHGWKVVDEYKSEELADNSEDEKRIRSAIKSAAAKSKPKSRIHKNRALPYQYAKRAPETYPNPDARSGNFRRYNAGHRYQTSSFSASPYATDICFGCGKAGHWRRSCPATFKNSTKDSSQ